MSDPASSPRPAPEGSADPVPAPEPRPAISADLRWPWFLLAAGLVIALLFVATDHILRATLALGGSLLGAAGLRAVLPERAAGGLRVRGRLLDVLVLAGLGIAVLVSGFTLDLRSLR